MSRKPFINRRTASFDQYHNPGSRTAEIGAGDQCLILSVAPLHRDEKVGVLVDLSFAQEDSPFEVRVDPKRVLIPGHNFDHLVEQAADGTPNLPTAQQCADFVAEARRLFDTDDLDAEVIVEMLTEQLTDMHIIL